MNSSLLFFSTVTKNSCKKQGHYNLLRGFATAFLVSKLNIAHQQPQHGEKLWSKEEFLYTEFVRCRVSCKREFKNFIALAEQQSSVNLRTVPYKSVLVANGVILLIDTASYFLKRQIQRKANMFLENGGFAERMHNMRDQSKK